MKTSLIPVIAVAFIVALPSCQAPKASSAKVVTAPGIQPPVEAKAAPKPAGSGQSGIASWYRDTRTASGERYNPNVMAAAHKTLPLGTKVQVRNKNNGRVVVVRINDRGPYKKGRVIDLTYLAAQKLGIVGCGLAPVEVTRLN